ncbi:hypothetical protein [Paenibacillus sp. IITD108]|uniref:hypothetical protein n=2 Tax=unclassified Paenibacillus TaxID=185978 RepID=UPI002F408C77
MKGNRAYMNQERRQIIVNEIINWRKSKLLPDQYCDFLLNLYADDEETTSIQQQQSAVGKAVATIQKATGLQWFLTLGTFTFISILVFYFSRFPTTLQISVVVLGTIALLWMGARIRKRSESSGIACIGIAMLVLLGGGLYILNLHEWEDMLWKILLLSACALLWIICGIKMNIPMLHLSGWLASLLVYGWMLYTYTTEPKWFEIQLYWLPIAVIFGWTSWFIHRWSKPVAAVLFVICALVWFMPEVYSLLAFEGTAIIQLQILFKIALGGAVLFLMRKRWMVWVV